ncbi:Six-hairpin glycosidase-like protein [Aspergillus avenaceus]|uniref:Six-hairpin glycosidase-like protein n=1 Tax=Aspergillus avenaceus TaxID=36643 RepID=A0A5N6TVC3_ASPAV|nr:Six-hairpin glycosidase-like protein [Aspergillus avenaceus]
MSECVVLGMSSLATATMWSSKPASWDTTNEAFAIGNGKLGVMPFGEPGAEKLNLNLDELWEGGPFQLDGYRGGNPNSSMVGILTEIRNEIWAKGTGNDSRLHGDTTGYGSFHSLANLTISIAGVEKVDNYNRSLDLSTGIHTTSYLTSRGTYTTATYCSYPAQVCVYELTSTAALSNVTVSLDQLVEQSSLYNTTCESDYVRLQGITQTGPPQGMLYDTIARSSIHGTCDRSTGSLTIDARNSSSLTIVIGAGTNFDRTKGTAETDYTFKGENPAQYVETITSNAALQSEPDLRTAHVADYSSLMGAFTLDLPDTQSSAGTDLSALITNYNADHTEGDPLLEKLLFDYGRHLFISSSRENSLPPNLQGVWSPNKNAAWGGDYHANINLQMNMWGAEATGLGNQTVSVFNYMEQNWMPRGAETAKLLYGGKGWVTHNEMNVFGHTGMKDWQTSSDYPVAPAWMMQHVWDHYDYTRNKTWFAEQGWPLLKGVAEFWLSQLQIDRFTNDSTLVVNPCTSPELGPVTFGCTHWQQLTHQVFETTLQGAAIVDSTDEEFLNNLKEKLKNLDKGLHIGSWGQVKEWKLPDSHGYEEQNNTHRHLSHLIGWYPGWTISSYINGYANKTIQSAISTSLLSRGVGIADANAGWEKVWRSACWALLNNTEKAHYELRLTIDQNMGQSGLSLYSGGDTPSGAFQIDANFGFVGAVLSMLVVDLPGKETERTVVLGPAIPAAWGGGSVRGLRIRGGGYVDFSWGDDGVVDEATVVGVEARVVNVKGDTLVSC